MFIIVICKQNSILGKLQKPNNKLNKIVYYLNYVKELII